MLRKPELAGTGGKFINLFSGGCVTHSLSFSLFPFSLEWLPFYSLGRVAFPTLPDDTTVQKEIKSKLKDQEKTTHTERER